MGQRGLPRRMIDHQLRPPAVKNDRNPDSLRVMQNGHCLGQAGPRRIAIAFEQPPQLRPGVHHIRAVDQEMLGGSGHGDQTLDIGLWTMDYKPRIGWVAFIALPEVQSPKSKVQSPHRRPKSNIAAPADALN